MEEAETDEQRVQRLLKEEIVIDPTTGDGWAVSARRRRTCERCASVVRLQCSSPVREGAGLRDNAAGKTDVVAFRQFRLQHSSESSTSP